jgi:hypothetical protein
MMDNYSVRKVTNIASDGIGIMLGDMVEGMTQEEYEVWLDYHFKTCKEPSLLGCSNHGLYICRKT